MTESFKQYWERTKVEREAWKIPIVGDMMQTPMGIVKVISVTDHGWTGDKWYGNIPFWEGGNWRIFKVVK